MTCEVDYNSKESIIWRIDPDLINNSQIKQSMFQPFECAGCFLMQKDDKKYCKSDKCVNYTVKAIKIDKFVKGDTASVQTTKGICNFHTHPFTCYDSPSKDEKTCWGWPSGEDMRECIRYILEGNRFHLVFAMEGTYLLQVNPNFLEILKNDKYFSNFKDSAGKKINPNEVRGLVISLIESYFKSTHGHRTLDYNTKYKSKPNKNLNTDCSKTWGICMPRDWINFANNFCIEKMNSSNNECSKLLPCNSFPEYDGKFSGSITLEEYINTYGLDLYSMNKKGHIVDISLTESNLNRHKSLIINNFDKFVDLFDNIKTNFRYGDEKWSKGQWFNILFFPNEFKINDKFITFDSLLDKCSKQKGELSKNLFKFWKECEKDPSKFKFTEIHTTFKPFKNGTCTKKSKPSSHKFNN